MSLTLPLISSSNYGKMEWAAAAATGLMGAAAIGAAIVGHKAPQLEYSKFGPRSTGVPSRLGMLLAYLPAALVGAFYMNQASTGYEKAVSFALTAHFTKRVLESLFLHRYSGGMAAGTVLNISGAYTTGTLLVLHTAFGANAAEAVQHLRTWAPIAWPIFLIAMLGNLYHHIILRNLRSGSEDKEYKAPRGGLFRWVVCPHYFLELVQFFSMALLSGQLIHWCWVLVTMGYFMDRGNNTLEWYRNKIPQFDPNHKMKKLIPFIF